MMDLPRNLATDFTVAVSGGERAIRVDTDEQEDAIHAMTAAAKKAGWGLRVFDAVRGSVWLNRPAAAADRPTAPGPAGPMAGLGTTGAGGIAQELVKFIDDLAIVDPADDTRVLPHILIVRNAHLMFDPRSTVSAAIQRLVEDRLRDIPRYGEPAHRQGTYRRIDGETETGKVVIGLMPSGAVLPPEVNPLFKVIEHELPDEAELKTILEGISVDGQSAGEPPPSTYKHALGLTRLQAEGVFSASAVRHGRIDPEYVWREKSAILNREKLLTLYDGRETFASVTGLDGAKRILRELLSPGELASVDPDCRAKGALFCGPPGCLHADTPVYDPTDATTTTVERRHAAGRPFHVLALDENGQVVVAEAEAPYCYPPARMLELRFASGRRIVVTEGHRFWGGADYLSAASVRERLRAGERVLLPTIEARDLSVQS